MVQGDLCFFAGVVEVNVLLAISHTQIILCHVGKLLVTGFTTKFRYACTGVLRCDVDDHGPQPLGCRTTKDTFAQNSVKWKAQKALM